MLRCFLAFFYEEGVEKSSSIIDYAYKTPYTAAKAGLGLDSLA